MHIIGISEEEKEKEEEKGEREREVAENFPKIMKAIKLQI